MSDTLYSKNERWLVLANSATLRGVLHDLVNLRVVAPGVVTSEINMASLNPRLVIWNPRDGVHKLEVEYRGDLDLLSKYPSDHFEFRVGKRRLHMPLHYDRESLRLEMRTLLVPEEKYVEGVIEKICTPISRLVELLVERIFALFVH